MDKADVVIIGGGPAGTVAAIECRRAGLSSILIERLGFPRERPGETLHPAIEPLLEQVGVANCLLTAGFLRHEGTWVEWNEGLKFVPFGTDQRGVWRGFQAWRAEFDLLLLEHAIKLGANVLQPCKALDILFADQKVVGVLTSRGLLRAQFVIDASGSQHWLATKLGSPLVRYSPTLIARYGYVEGTCSERDHAPMIRADEHGWTWTARVQAGVYQWTRLKWDQKMPGSEFPNEFIGLRTRGGTRGADVTWRMIADAAGPGYFITGDAVAVLDPASSHGVIKAIMSGMMAVHCIKSILFNKKSPQKASDDYCKWLRGWFLHDVTQLRQFYLALHNPPAWLLQS